eukprot:64190-Pleurochrysis_carterae.AAC.1
MAHACITFAQELSASSSTAWATAEHESLEGKYPGGGIQLLDSALKTFANVSAYFKRSRKKVHMTAAEKEAAKVHAEQAEQAAKAAKDAKAAKAAAAAVAAATAKAAHRPRATNKADTKPTRVPRAAATRKPVYDAEDSDDDEDDDDEVEEIKQLPKVEKPVGRAPKQSVRKVYQAQAATPTQAPPTAAQQPEPANRVPLQATEGANIYTQPHARP